MKILTIKDLDAVRSEAAKKLMLRELGERNINGDSSGLDTGTERMQVLVCGGTGCKASSSQLICDRLREKLKEK